MKYVVGGVSAMILLCLLFIVSIKMDEDSLGKTNHTAIIVSGLGDNRESKVVTYLWGKRGIRIVYFQSNWKSKEDYKSKLKRLIDLIDGESDKNQVSLIGTSAGGSLAINAFSERKDSVNKVITICSRLKVGEQEGFRGFISRTNGYPAFKESVTKSAEKELGFNEYERNKIMTIRALLGDELVPNNTSTIDGAKNIVVPIGEHVLSITSSLTVFLGPLVKFIVK